MKLNQNQVVVFKCCGREWTVSGEAATFDRERGCFCSRCPKCGAKVLSDCITVKRADKRTQVRR